MISCASHDFVEIACLYRFEVKLVLKNGQILHGIACQTTYNEAREECILLETETGSEAVVLEQVTSMEAVTSNPHFVKINLV